MSPSNLLALIYCQFTFLSTSAFLEKDSQRSTIPSRPESQFIILLLNLFTKKLIPFLSFSINHSFYHNLLAINDVESLDRSRNTLTCESEHWL